MNILLWCDLELYDGLECSKITIKEGETIVVSKITERTAFFNYDGKEFKLLHSALLLAGKRF